MFFLFVLNIVLALVSSLCTILIILVVQIQEAVEYSGDAVHARDQYSMTAVMHAIAGLQHDCVKVILDHAKSTNKLDVCQRTHRGNTVSVTVFNIWLFLFIFLFLFVTEAVIATLMQ